MALLFKLEVFLAWAAEDWINRAFCLDSYVIWNQRLERWVYGY